MNHLVLARKWRPLSLKSVIGQDHVIKTLKHAIDSGRVHHAWIFTGTRGVGKTTLSRILSKCLNCESGITSNPCGNCQVCKEIDSGNFIDYIELDAASNRGIDEMVQLLEQALYSPSIGRFKIYMIDEVHMLTSYAFSAMLKLLEEPPPYIKFILATTDPQKVPITILSRCLQMNLKKVSSDIVSGYLQYIFSQEKIKFELTGLNLIAKAAKGSVRDALSLADQSISYSAGHVSENSVRDMLGFADDDYLIQLMNAIMFNDVKSILDLANKFEELGLSYQNILSDLAILLSRIAIEQHVHDGKTNDCFSENILNFSREVHPDILQLFYSIVIYSQNELNLAPDEYSGFLMTCLRMVSINSDIDVSNTTKGDIDLDSDFQSSNKSKKSEISSLRNSLSLISNLSKKQLSSDTINLESVSSINWPNLVLQLPIKGLSAQLAQQSEWISTNGKVIEIRVGVQALAEQKNQLRLQDALSKYFSSKIELKVIIEPTGLFTANAIETLKKDNLKIQAGKAVENDILIQTLVSDFDGKIVPGTVSCTEDAILI
ncbi:MAG: DNA polymerase III subunit gamma/tau [Bordetella sp.]|nr:MAG: DNA polymerase III subunit gamma/tau [Bordetella sp.]